MKIDVEAKSHLEGNGGNMMVRLIIDADRMRLNGTNLWPKEILGTRIPTPSHGRQG